MIPKKAEQPYATQSSPVIVEESFIGRMRKSLISHYEHLGSLSRILPVTYGKDGNLVYSAPTPYQRKPVSRGENFFGYPSFAHF
jgi:hypothetical protein